MVCREHCCFDFVLILRFSLLFQLCMQWWRMNCGKLERDEKNNKHLFPRWVIILNVKEKCECVILKTFFSDEKWRTFTESSSSYLYSIYFHTSILPYSHLLPYSHTPIYSHINWTIIFWHLVPTILICFLLILHFKCVYFFHFIYFNWIVRGIAYTTDGFFCIKPFSRTTF